jgi:hypothetical protein
LLNKTRAIFPYFKGQPNVHTHSSSLGNLHAYGNYYLCSPTILYLSATIIKYCSILQKALDETNLQDELGTPEVSGDPEAEQNISSLQEEVPDPKERRHGKINILQKNKVDKLKYIESTKALKVGKKRGLEKLLPLHSILKKYTKHTSVKMVKEKHRNPRRAGVIKLCRKSVKRVKFSEANDVLGSNKQSSKVQQLENICKIFSDAMTSSSSTDMSSEGDRPVTAESSSYIPEKAFAKANKEKENTVQVKGSNLSNTGSSGLFDLNQALPESTELNNPCISTSEGLNLEHRQDGTFSVDEQDLDMGRANQKHATDLDVRAKGKSSYAAPNRTVHDSVQLQQSWCSMTLHHGVPQLSTGGELPSCQFPKFNLSHSAKPNLHSEMNVRQERRPGQTFRLMGKDLTVSRTRVSYLAETSQKHTADKHNINEKMVLGLPRQDQPFLSLQAPSVPIVSVSSASTVHDSANPASKSQAQFEYRTPHNFSQPLPNANLFSGDPSPYEDRFRDPANSETCQNVLLGCPPLPDHGSESVLKNVQSPWHKYSDHSTRKEPSSEPPLVPAVTRHVTSSSDYHANWSPQYGVHSAGSSVRSHNYVSFTLNNPDQADQGVSVNRVSSAFPSRNVDSGVAKAVPDNSNASSSGCHVLRSGPVKLSAGAKHILMPNESTVDDNAAPLYSRLSFGSSSTNAPRGKGVDFRKS